MRILPAAFLIVAFAATPLQARPGAGAGFAAHVPNGSLGIGQSRARLSSFGSSRAGRDHRHRGPRPGRREFGYGGWGYAGEASYGPMTGGFFIDGEAIPTRRGVAYDYDRGYPYDHYREAGSPALDLPPPRLYRCDVEAGVRVCRR